MSVFRKDLFFVCKFADAFCAKFASTTIKPKITDYEESCFFLDGAAVDGFIIVGTNTKESCCI
jgi:hypothetical protein